MATLYRCSRCKKIFSSVFGQGENQVCRGCKTGDAAGSAPGSEKVTIVEPTDSGAVVVNPQDASPAFFTSKEEKIAALNELTRQVFARNPSLGQFDGAPVGLPGEKYVNVSDGRLDGVWLPNGKIKLKQPIIEKRTDGSSIYVDMIDPQDGYGGYDRFVEGAVREPVPEPAPVAEVEPHAAMLNPTRKMRISK